MFRSAASGGAGENPFRVALSDPTEVDLLARQTSEARARLRAALHVLVAGAPCELLLAVVELARAVCVSAYLGRVATRGERRRADPPGERDSGCADGRADGEAVFGVERTTLNLTAALGKALYGRVGRALGGPLVMRLLGARKVGGGHRERYALAVGSRVAGGRPVAGCFREPRTAVRLFCVLGRSESIPGAWTLRWCVFGEAPGSGAERRGHPPAAPLESFPGARLFSSPNGRDALSVFFREPLRTRASVEHSRGRSGGCPAAPKSGRAKAPAA